MEKVSLRQQLGERFQKKAEKMPEVQVHILFNEHKTYEQGLAIREAIEKYKPDIVIPEGLGHNPLREKRANQVAQGQLSVVMAQPYNEYQRGFMNALAGTDCTVVYADVPETHELIRIRAQEVFESRMSQDAFFEWMRTYPDFETLRNAYLERAQKMNDFQNSREEYIVNNFSETLVRAFKTRQELKKKDAIRVLMVMGASHRTLSRKLSQTIEEAVSHSLTGKTFTFSYTSQLLQEMKYGRQPQESLIHKALIEEMIYETAHAVFESQNAPLSRESLRALVDAFDEIADVKLLATYIQTNNAVMFNLLFRERFNEFVDKHAS